MAHHNKTPDSVLNAPPRIFAYAEDKDGNPIKFEGANRSQLRKHGVGVTGASRSSLAARRKPEHPFVTERRAKAAEAAREAVKARQEAVVKRWWQHIRSN